MNTGKRMSGFLDFLQYHNTIPIALGIVVLGGTGVFAATNPEAIYSETQEVLTVDNTYLVGKDLSSYSPRTVITNVREDETDYYVEYEFYTIDVDNYVWRDVVRNETMQVSKSDLGEYRDLGLYVTQQLRQVIDRESSRLARTQENARSAVSQLTVATTYGGLIGKFLDESTETLPGYAPVVQPQVAAAAIVYGPAEGAGSAPSGGSPSSIVGSLKIGLQLLGNNPAKIPLGATYADLGAVLIDPYRTNIGVYMTIDGEERATWTGIDTSTTSVHTIEYRATDPGGTVITVRRIVLVGDSQDPGGAVSEAGNVHPVIVQEGGVGKTEETGAATTGEEGDGEATNDVEGTSAATSATSTADTASEDTIDEQSASEGVAGEDGAEEGEMESTDQAAGIGETGNAEESETATSTPSN